MPSAASLPYDQLFICRSLADLKETNRMNEPNGGVAKCFPSGLSYIPDVTIC
jgi:hypothetical protein